MGQQDYKETLIVAIEDAEATTDEVDVEVEDVAVGNFTKIL